MTHTLCIHFPGTFFQLNRAYAFQWEYFRPRSSILPGGHRVWNLFTSRESRANFKVNLDQENGNILKNCFYQRILLVSKYPKREWTNNFYFFKILLDGPLYRFYDINFPFALSWMQSRKTPKFRVISSWSCFFESLSYRRSTIAWTPCWRIFLLYPFSYWWFSLITRNNNAFTTHSINYCVVLWVCGFINYGFAVLALSQCHSGRLYHLNGS